LKKLIPVDPEAEKPTIERPPVDLEGSLVGFFFIFFLFSLWLVGWKGNKK
jgi:hypothetical protein